MASYTLLCLVALISLKSVVCSKEDVESGRMETVNKCKKEHDFEGELEDIKFEDVPQNAKCFMACLLSEDKILTEDGRLDFEVEKEVIKEVLTEQPEKQALFSKIHESCSHQVKPHEDNCETAFEYMKCKFTEMKKKD